MIPHCSFDLHFLLVMLSIFSCANCMSCLEKCVFKSSIYFLIGSFVLLILTCMSCLYILEINPLLVSSFAIFSPVLRVVSSFYLLFLLLCKSFYV